MSYTILACGYRKTFDLLSFDPTSAKLKVTGESPAPPSASWIEPTKDTKKLFAISEDQKVGKVTSIEVQGNEVKITSEAPAQGTPAHVHVMKDQSAVVAANYAGGSIIYIPLDSEGKLKGDSSIKLDFPFAYKDQKAPNEERQEASHPHQVLEADGGKMYVNDLGSDRVWVVKKEGDKLEIKGWLQAPGGSGPRHAVISPDGKYMYLLTEMGHSVLLYSLDNPSYPIHPTPDIDISIAPPSVPPSHSKYLDSAEISLNPKIPHVIYASNRLELHIEEKNKDLPKLPGPKPEGDAIAILLLNDKGDKVEEVKHVRTGCDNIRAMQVSPDGNFVAVGGQLGGGVEIWSVGGGRGDDWKLAAKEESIEGITDFVWL